ncbi:hypothetical protein ACWCQP_47680 [Streptomyces chartreusis]
MKTTLVYPLVVLCAYSDVAAALLALLGVGMGTGDTLRQYGVGTDTAFAVAFPLAGLAAWATAVLWRKPLGSGRPLADVCSEVADRIADWGGLADSRVSPDDSPKTGR